MKFPHLKNKELAEFVGIMLGDGLIGIYKCKHMNKIKTQYQVKVTLDSRNIQYTDYVVDLFKKIFGIEPKLNYKKSENTVDIRCFKKELLIFLTEKVGLKLSPKWNNVLIPKYYLISPYNKLVLKGLFDTDGCLSIFKNNNVLYPRLELKVSPSPMQKQVADILKERGFRFTIQNLERGKIRIRLSGKSQLEKWLVDVGFSNKIHLEKATNFLKDGAARI